MEQVLRFKCDHAESIKRTKLIRKLFAILFVHWKKVNEKIIHTEKFTWWFWNRKYYLRTGSDVVWPRATFCFYCPHAVSPGSIVISPEELFPLHFLSDVGKWRHFCLQNIFRYESIFFNNIFKFFLLFELAIDTSINTLLKIWHLFLKRWRAFLAFLC